MEIAIEKGEWDRVVELLRPIGAPGWATADPGAPVYAWEPRRRARVSASWIHLRGLTILFVPRGQPILLLNSIRALAESETLRWCVAVAPRVDGCHPTKSTPSDGIYWLWDPKAC